MASEASESSGGGRAVLLALSSVSLGWWRRRDARAGPPSGPTGLSLTSSLASDVPAVRPLATAARPAAPTREDAKRKSDICGGISGRLGGFSDRGRNSHGVEVPEV